jgi:hypothetical protein
VTFSPAMFCSSIATCSSTWPSQVPSSSRMRRIEAARLAVRATVLLRDLAAPRPAASTNPLPEPRPSARPRARPGPAQAG